MVLNMCAPVPVQMHMYWCAPQGLRASSEQVPTQLHSFYAEQLAELQVCICRAAFSTGLHCPSHASCCQHSQGQHAGMWITAICC